MVIVVSLSYSNSNPQERQCQRMLKYNEYWSIDISVASDCSSFGYRPSSTIVGSYISCNFNILRNCILFSTVVVSVYIPTYSTWGFCFLCILTNTCSLLSEFWLAYPWLLEMWSTFLYTHWPFVCLFRNSLFLEVYSHFIFQGRWFALGLPWWLGFCLWARIICLLSVIPFSTQSPFWQEQGVFIKITNCIY